MRWIILALSLGASVTSIIHGVFMLFGSLSIGAGPVGLSAIWLASLPIISAISALIGGIVAFSGSRWGALFLALATVLCAFAPRDIWIYGALYCVGALLCIFLRPHQEHVDYYYDDYDEDGQDGMEGEDEEDYEEMYERRMARGSSKRGMEREPLPPAPETPSKVRRRTSKTCPYCGATVAIEHRFCPECGESLHIPAHAPVPAPEEPEERPEDAVAAASAPEEPLLSQPIPSVKPLSIIEPSPLPREEAEENFQENFQTAVPTKPAQVHKVFVRPDREEMELPRRPINIDPDMSYQQFAQYTHNRRGKYRRRSVGRRVLSILLLIGAVGGALWFLLGLRKLPEGELPPAVRPTPPAAEERPDDVLVQPVQPKAAVADELPSFTPDRSPKSGIITRTNVNMRADHTTSSKKVATLSQNTRFSILESWSGPDYPWYRIRTQTQNREGWVRGDLLQLLGGELPTGYTNALLRSCGKNQTELSEKLGQPSKSTNTTMEWSGLSATLRGDDVSRLRLSNSRHELKNGLKVGMSQTALLQIMGYPSSVSQRQTQYNEGGKAGVNIQLSRDGLIQTITVNEIQ